jgi:hypothetical protein
MKLYLYQFMIIILLGINIFSQNQISLKPGFGFFIYNSENSLKVMADKNYLINYGFGISFEKEDLFGYNSQIEYSYTFSGRDKTLEFIRTVEGGPEPLGNYYSNTSLLFHNIDISLKGNLSEYFSYGFGPSLTIVNRTIEVPFIHFEEILASLCLGLNGIIDVILPFTEDINYFYFIAGLKIRYTHGIWYDNKGRYLDNYNQNFITINVSAGFGYNF